jgi:magnesium-transporting ATPase (P-type)
MWLESGRWNYHRMSKLIPYLFYKNITYSMAQFWFSILFAGWSGQKFYIEMANTTVDVVYTGLPILLLAVLDQDVSAKSAVRFPFLYTDGIRRSYLTSRIFW